MADLKLDATPTAEEELELFRNPDDRRKHLENIRLKDENVIRLKYVRSAKRLSEIWVGFSILVTIAQFIKPAGLHLETAEFIAIVATALASVIALWAIVGTGLFGRK